MIVDIYYIFILAIRHKVLPCDMWRYSAIYCIYAILLTCENVCNIDIAYPNSYCIVAIILQYCPTLLGSPVSLKWTKSSSECVSAVNWPSLSTIIMFFLNGESSLPFLPFSLLKCCHAVHCQPGVLEAPHN